MTPTRKTADVRTMVGRIFTMAIDWNERNKPWDEELIIRLFRTYRNEALREAAGKARQWGGFSDIAGSISADAIAKEIEGLIE
jgi:hypothetical protein